MKISLLILINNIFQNYHKQNTLFIYATTKIISIKIFNFNNPDNQLYFAKNYLKKIV